MYGTIARFRIKPGMEQEVQALMREEEAGLGARDTGFVKTYIYQMDQDPSEYYMVVLFKDKAAYHANAASPEQNASYERLIEMMEGAPEWHDGEVVYESA